MTDKIKVQEFHFFRWVCPFCNHEMDDNYSPEHEHGSYCDKCGHEFDWESFDPEFEDM